MPPAPPRGRRVHQQQLYTNEGVKSLTAITCIEITDSVANIYLDD